MVKSLANAARAVVSGRLGWRTWATLVSIALVVMAPVAWAFWAPQTNHGVARAAVVNNDEPVTVNGQIIPLGRLMAGYLTHSHDSSYTWVLTNNADATSGLRGGRYAAAVLIPAEFSTRATSPATASPLEAEPAHIRVETSKSARLVDPAAATQVARAVQHTLNQTIVQTYLDNVYIGFSTIHDQINQAADGAAQLTAGTGQLADGAHQLTAGTGQLDEGAHQLATAADQLAAGANQLAAGAGQLASGTSQLADGSTQLTAGLNELQQRTADLPALSRQLADGAAQVAAGDEKIADIVVPLANRIIDLIDALPSTQSALAQLHSAVAQCPRSGPSAQFCGVLGQAVTWIASQSETIETTRTAIRQTAVSTRDQVQALATGARQVANGTKQLADSAPALTGGIAAAATGARALDNGVKQAHAGAAQLASGGRQLANGADQLASGADQLASGADQVNSGAQQLATGADQVNGGAHQLSNGLDSARDKVPSYSADERDHLKQVVADPTRALVSPIGYGRPALALGVVLALWACALATFLFTRALPRAVRTSRQSTWRIVAEAALPGVITASAAAAVLSLVAAPVLHLSFIKWAEMTLVTALAALAFVALNQSATAVFGRFGRLASIAVLVLTVTGAVISTIPGPLATISGWLPTQGAFIAVRAIAVGGSGVLAGTAQLVIWLAFGVLAAVLVVERRRSLSSRQLRPGTRMPAAS